MNKSQQQSATLSTRRAGETTNNQLTSTERYNVDTTKEITHLSLCTGYEGLGLGLRRVLPNLREIAYVEREGFPIANLVAKIESGQLDEAPIFTDVKTFPYGKFRGCVDILSGGFPCQPFSAAGKRQATEDPRHLFPYIRDGIRDCQPRIVFLENVEGIISAKTGDGESVLQYVLRELEGLGYRATAGVFSASEVGAPHQRKRVFILGYSSHERCEQNTALRSEQQASWTNEVSGESRGELGYSEHNGCITSEESRETSGSQEEGRVQESQGGSHAPTELANSNHEGLEGHHLDSTSEQGEPVQADTWTASSTRWPSRPSEAQQEWEAPRVTGMADTESQQGSSSNHRGESGATCQSEQGEPRGGHCRSLRKSDRQTESRLGRATDGTANRVDATANRVDRLRLLGNGVVPATAAKAFLTLINRVI